MKNFLKTILVLTACAGLSACSTTEYASHLLKSSGGKQNYNTANAGNFKVGKPYTVLGQTYAPREKYEYAEEGMASWYGPGFHGNKTANGEIYDKYDLTAAHRTLQMPSVVRVTNLNNNKSVIVRVNDRGPFAKGRIIDISKRAAQQIEMIGTGTAPVRVELLERESKILAEAAKRGMKTQGAEIALNETGRLPEQFYQFDMAQIETASGNERFRDPLSNPQNRVEREQLSMDMLANNSAPSQQAPLPSIAGQDIFVQVGAFGNQQNAQNLSNRLASISPTRIDSVGYDDGRTLYKVRMGPMQSQEEASRILNQVRQAGQNDAAIITKK